MRSSQLCRLGRRCGSRSERTGCETGKEGADQVARKAVRARGGRWVEERRTKCEGTAVFMIAGKAATRCGSAPCLISRTPNSAWQIPVSE